MPGLQQVSTQQIPPVVGSADPLSPEFAQNRIDRFTAQTAPQAHQGLRDLRSYIRSSRGLADSGIEASQVAGAMQSRDRQIGDYAGQVGEDQANMAERNRVREQQRGWQKEDQAWQERQDAIRADAAKQAAQDQMWGSIVGGAAGLAGNVLFPALRGTNAAAGAVKPTPVSPPIINPYTGFDGSISEPSYPQVVQ